VGYKEMFLKKVIVGWGYYCEAVVRKGKEEADSIDGGSEGWVECKYRCLVVKLR
jgi:hypothetical protein